MGSSQKSSSQTQLSRYGQEVELHPAEKDPNNQGTAAEEFWNDENKVRSIKQIWEKYQNPDPVNHSTNLATSSRLNPRAKPFFPSYSQGPPGQYVMMKDAQIPGPKWFKFDSQPRSQNQADIDNFKSTYGEQGQPRVIHKYRPRKGKYRVEFGA